MNIITRLLAVVSEPQFKLARDLTAMAITDGLFEGELPTYKKNNKRIIINKNKQQNFIFYVENKSPSIF